MVAILPRMGRPKKSEASQPLRVPASFLKRVKRVAAHRGVDPGDYVARAMSGELDRDEAEMLRAIAEERGEQPGKGKAKK